MLAPQQAPLLLAARKAGLPPALIPAWELDGSLHLEWLPSHSTQRMLERLQSSSYYYVCMVYKLHVYTVHTRVFFWWGMISEKNLS